MKEKYIIRIVNAKTQKEKAVSKYVGIFYSREDAVTHMHKYYAEEVKRLLKRMSKEKYEREYCYILEDDFVNIWKRGSNEDVCAYFLFKVEDAE